MKDTNTGARYCEGCIPFADIDTKGRFDTGWGKIIDAKRIAEAEALLRSLGVN